MSEKESVFEKLEKKMGDIAEKIFDYRITKVERKEGWKKYKEQVFSGRDGRYIYYRLKTDPKITADRRARWKSYLTDKNRSYSNAEESSYFRALPLSTESMAYKWCLVDTKNKELDALLHKIISAKFDVNKIDSHMAKNLKLIYEEAKKAVKVSRALENSMVGLYIDIYETAMNNKVKSFGVTLYKELQKANLLNTSVFKAEWRGSWSREEGVPITLMTFILILNVELIYTGSLLHSFMYQMQMNSVDHTESLWRDFDKKYEMFLSKAVLPAVHVADYFKYSDLNKMGKLLKSLFDKINSKNKGKESLEFYNTISEEMGNVKASYNNKSEEAVGVIAAITVGTILGLIALVPTIRACLYYIQSLKVDISNLFIDNAEMMEADIKVLEEKHAAETNPKEKERLAKILKKSYEWAARLKRWSEFWYSESERKADESEQQLQRDEQKEEKEMQEYRDNDSEGESSSDDDYYTGEEDDTSSQQNEDSDPDVFI